FGGFSSAEYNEVIYIGITLFIGIIVLCSLIPKIKILQLGHLKGTSLGLNVQSLTYCVLLIASLITAVIVAYVGIIGFICMIIAQLVRRQGQQFNLGQQMVLNMIIGGIVMVMAARLDSIW